MGKYMIRRLLQLIPIFFLVSVLIFGIIQLAPGSPLASFYADPNMTVEQLRRLEEVYGLNRPIYLQYFDYVSNMVQGDLGHSHQLKQPVTKLIGERIGPTFYLAFGSLLISLIIAVPVGVISATKQYSVFDYAGTIFALIGISIPGFFFSLLMIRYFGVHLRWFPISGMKTAGASYPFPQNFIDIFKHSVMPLTVLGLTGAAQFMRFTRSSMLEVIRQDYVRTARAKGLKERVVVYKHALRNALIPVVTLLGFQLPILFSGSLMVEILFVYPGMGQLQYNSVLHRDYPVMMGANLFLAALTLLGNLLADISYAFIDPRIRYD